MKTERQKQLNKEWYERAKQDPVRFQKLKEINREGQRRWRAANKQKVLSRRVAKYGLSLDEYTNLLEKQGNKCKLCSETKNLHIDHCHSTGKVRGILCRNCNRGLGLLKDSIEVFEKAINYLKGLE